MLDSSVEYFPLELVQDLHQAWFWSFIRTTKQITSDLVQNLGLHTTYSLSVSWISGLSF